MFRYWVGSIMTIKGWPESVKARSIVQRVYEAYPESTIMCEDALDRSLLQPLHGFPECMLQGSARFARWRAILSCKRKIILLLPWLSIT